MCDSSIYSILVSLPLSADAPLLRLPLIRLDIKNFNRAFWKCWFEILTSYRLAIAQDQHCEVINWSDYQREKSIAISKHDVCGNNYKSKNALHRMLQLHNSLTGKNGEMW